MIFFQIQDVATRWNSTHDMISRFLQHKRSLTEITEAKRLPTLTEAEWERLRVMEILLKPCKDVTKNLGKNHEHFYGTGVVIVAHLRLI